MPMRLPSMNALKTQPYSRIPPRSSATTGITVTTARASDATKVIVMTKPAVSERRAGAHRPSARSANGIGDDDAVHGGQVGRVALAGHGAQQGVEPIEADDLPRQVLERPTTGREQLERGAVRHRVDSE